MRYETVTPGGNVIRFPVDLRAKPSIDCLIDVAPDPYGAGLLAVAYGFDRLDLEARSEADRAMAERIATTELPGDLIARRVALNAMLEPIVERAVAACAKAHQAVLRSKEAGEKLARAQIEGGHWLKRLEDAANNWAVESARLLLAAHEAARAAHGAARAIEMAKRGEAWGPADLDEDLEFSVAVANALARRAVGVDGDWT